MTVTRDSVSRYRRQRTAEELKRAATYMGENDPGTFDATSVYFAAEYEDLSPSPTSGLAWNGRGGNVEYALPRVPPETVDLKVLDWDIDLRMQFEQWQFDREVIRWWAPGSHFIVGTIEKVQINRPAGDKLQVTIRCRGIYYYDTDTPAQFNTAFPNNLVSHGRFMGSQA